MRKATKIIIATFLIFTSLSTHVFASTPTTMILESNGSEEHVNSLKKQSFIKQELLSTFMKDPSKHDFEIDNIDLLTSYHMRNGQVDIIETKNDDGTISKHISTPKSIFK